MDFFSDNIGRSYKLEKLEMVINGILLTMECR